MTPDERRAAPKPDRATLLKGDSAYASHWGCT
jgi:hypothetical protein